MQATPALHGGMQQRWSGAVPPAQPTASSLARSTPMASTALSPPPPSHAYPAAAAAPAWSMGAAAVESGHHAPWMGPSYAAAPAASFQEGGPVLSNGSYQEAATFAEARCAAAMGLPHAAPLGGSANIAAAPGAAQPWARWQAPGPSWGAPPLPAAFAPHAFGQHSGFAWAPRTESLQSLIRGGPAAASGPLTGYNAPAPRWQGADAAPPPPAPPQPTVFLGYQQPQQQAAWAGYSAAQVPSLLRSRASYGAPDRDCFSLPSVLIYFHRSCPLPVSSEIRRPFALLAYAEWHNAGSGLEPMALNPCERMVDFWNTKGPFFG